MLEREYWVNRS